MINSLAPNDITCHHIICNEPVTRMAAKGKMCQNNLWMKIIQLSVCNICTCVKYKRGKIIIIMIQNMVLLRMISIQKLAWGVERWVGDGGGGGGGGAVGVHCDLHASRMFWIIIMIILPLLYFTQVHMLQTDKTTHNWIIFIHKLFCESLHFDVSTFVFNRTTVPHAFYCITMEPNVIGTFYPWLPSAWQVLLLFHASIRPAVGPSVLLSIPNDNVTTLNSLWPDDAIWRHRSG